MILINLDNETEVIKLTLRELTTLQNANYLFVFKSVVLGKTIKFIRSVNDDISAFPNRINIFSVIPLYDFEDCQSGQYQYKVYEQASNSNLDETGLNMVECGKAILVKQSNLVVHSVDTTTTYISYGD